MQIPAKFDNNRISLGKGLRRGDSSNSLAIAIPLRRPGPNQQDLSFIKSIGTTRRRSFFSQQMRDMVFHSIPYASADPAAHGREHWDRVHCT